MLSTLVTTFLPRSKYLLISRLQSPCAVILEPKKIKSLFSLFPHLFTMKVWEAGKVVWYSHLFKNFSVCCNPHSQRFDIVNKAEVDVFLKLSCFFSNPTDTDNLISCSSDFSKSSLNIWKVYWSLSWRILSMTLLACEMSPNVSSLNILWHCLSLGLEWKLIFASPVATTEFSKFAGILSAAL